MAPHILSVDLGSTNAKAAIVDVEGRIGGVGVCEIPTLHQPNGHVEQDPGALWEAVLSACRSALRMAGGTGFSVVGVCVCGQYSSTLPVDANGRPLANLVMWLDTRGAPYIREILDSDPDRARQWAAIHGLSPSPAGHDSLAHILWFKRAAPEIYARTHAFLEPVDFVNMRFTGEISANQCSVFKFMVTDNRKNGVREYHSDLLAWSGIDGDKLPPLAAFDEDVGRIDPRVAAELGVARDVSVGMAMNDSQAQIFGCGALRPETAGVSIGTTTVLATLSSEHRPRDATGLATMPFPDQNRFVVMAENGLGGKVVEFALGQLLSEPEPSPSSPAFEDLDRQVMAVEPGSEGVLFLPWVIGAAAPAPNPQMRGGFLNVSIGTTRNHLVRAVLEGVALNLRWINDAVEDFTSRRFERYVLTGGGAQSDAWTQIIADVLGRPVARTAAPRYATALGAAFFAFRRLGFLDEEANAAFVADHDICEPRPDLSDRYSNLFVQFKHAYHQILPICQVMNP